MSTIDPALQSFVRRVHAMMIYRSVLRWSALWLMIAGVVVLGIRFTSDLPGDWWKYLLASWALLVAIAWYPKANADQIPNSYERIRPAKPRGRLGDGRRRGGHPFVGSPVRSLALPSVQWHSGSAWLGTILALVFFITGAARAGKVCAPRRRSALGDQPASGGSSRAD